jgi:hypothetical protein
LIPIHTKPAYIYIYIYIYAKIRTKNFGHFNLKPPPPTLRFVRGLKKSETPT